MLFDDPEQLRSLKERNKKAAYRGGLFIWTRQALLPLSFLKVGPAGGSSLTFLRLFA